MPKSSINPINEAILYSSLVIIFGKPLSDLDSDQRIFVIDSMNRIVDNLLKKRNGGIVSLNQLTQPLGYR